MVQRKYLPEHPAANPAGVAARGGGGGGGGGAGGGGGREEDAGECGSGSMMGIGVGGGGGGVEGEMIVVASLIDKMPNLVRACGS